MSPPIGLRYLYILEDDQNGSNIFESSAYVMI
jgi:hypothetical protein